MSGLSPCILYIEHWLAKGSYECSKPIFTLRTYIFAFISLNRILSLSMLISCWGQPTISPSSSLGLGILLGQSQDPKQKQLSSVELSYSPYESVPKLPRMSKLLHTVELAENSHGRPPDVLSCHCSVICCNHPRQWLRRASSQWAIIHASAWSSAVHPT